MNTNLLKDWKHDWFGFWREGEYFPECPFVEDFIDASLRYPDEDKLLAYLDTAPVIQVFGAKFKCKLCDAYLPVGSQSDGVIVWPIDLHHYVKVHGVVLPQRFANRIRSLNYAAPSKCGKTWNELPRPSAKAQQ